MNPGHFMEQGIGKIIQAAGRFYLKSPAGCAFLAGAVPALKRSASLRRQQGAQGLLVPPLLIASITSQCNLHCLGCYARASGTCGEPQSDDLSAAQWHSVFAQADELGISFIFLAGGEPLLRRDVLEAAAHLPHLIFPVFTNGTLLDNDALQLFERHRNLIPVLSVEGGENATDARRGRGTHARIKGAMTELKHRGILFGISVTVDRNNLKETVSVSFAAMLRQMGCGLLLYVEYIPVQEGTAHLVLKEEQTQWMTDAIAHLKQCFSDMIVLSFPGDEAAMGGCLAAGRGFFHIGPTGAAEPCPFSPHSRHNLKSSSIAEILRSGFFADLRELACDLEYRGGCTLFAQQETVRCLAAEDRGAAAPPP